MWVWIDATAVCSSTPVCGGGIDPVKLYPLLLGPRLWSPLVGLHDGRVQSGDLGPGPVLLPYKGWLYGTHASTLYTVAIATVLPPSHTYSTHSYSTSCCLPTV